MLIRVITLLCVAAVVRSAAAGGPTGGGQPPATAPSVLAPIPDMREADLSTLEQLPAPADLTDLRLYRGSVPAALTQLGETEMRELLRRATPIRADDPSIREFAYAPWLLGTFRTTEGLYRFELFLGGRGRLLTPTGKWGYFAFPARLSAPGPSTAEVQK